MFSTALLVSIGIILLFLISTLAFIVNCYKKAQQGQAIIRTGIGATQVAFHGMFIIPFLHQYEILDITLKRIKVDCTRDKALISKDGKKLNIQASVYIRVNPDIMEVLRVSQSIGINNANNQKHLEGIFQSWFTTELKKAVRDFDFKEIEEVDEKFLRQIFINIGNYLHGFVLDNITIDSVEEIPLKKTKQLQ